MRRRRTWARSWRGCGRSTRADQCGSTGDARSTPGSRRSPRNGTGSYDALFAIVEERWQAYRHWDDLVRRGIVLEIAPGEVLVWRRYVEFLDRFRVLYAGPVYAYTVKKRAFAANSADRAMITAR